jgi:uncharacterized protein YbjQ (UPF0145 family)
MTRSESMFEEAMNLIKSNNTDEAIKVFNKILNIFPTSDEAKRTCEELNKLGIDSKYENTIELNKKLNNIIVTTSSFIPNYKIEDILDIVSAEVVLGMNIFKDLISSISDVVGGRSNTIQNLLKDYKRIALNDIKREANLLGAHAIINTRINYSEINGQNKSMFMITIYGTAVKLNKASTDL